MKKSAKNLSRRKFIGQVSCAAVGSASLFSTLLNLRMASTAAAQSDPLFVDTPYRALVCLFLGGGNDSYNMLAPIDSTSYAQYADVRSDLAIPRDEFLPLTPRNNLQGRQLGLHPSMPEVRDLFQSDDVALVTNVGTLVQPITLQEFKNDLKPIPRGLFSHSDQVEQWQTSVPDSAANFGWGGRTADLLGSLNDNDRIAMNISLNGTNLWQSGERSTQYQITPDGSISRDEYDTSPGGWNAMVGAAVDSQLDQQYANLFQQTYSKISRDAIQTHEEFSAATGSVTPFTATVFTDPNTDTYDEIRAINELAAYFTMVAKTIASNGTLGLRRQTFFIKLDGWDHHDEVIKTQGSMLKTVSRCLGYFNALMKEIQMNEQVTLFTASDFARTLTSNGKGSDHGWGGNQIVMGGDVKGRRIFGDYPELYADNNLDTGRGRLIPTLAVDQYFAELATWLGVQASDLSAVLPNIERFYTPRTGAWPIGFLG